MTPYDLWQQADSLERAHARALPDGADPFSGAYAEEAQRLNEDRLRALARLCGMDENVLVIAVYGREK